jgi:hypothetical protein
MEIRSGRQVALLWVGALLLFLICAWASRALHPSHPVDRPSASYYVGLVGLVAIGVALVLTWRWVGHAGPASSGARAGLQALLLLGGVLWLAAMVFPFL